MIKVKHYDKTGLHEHKCEASTEAIKALLRRLQSSTVVQAVYIQRKKGSVRIPQWFLDECKPKRYHSHDVVLFREAYICSKVFEACRRDGILKKGSIDAFRQQTERMGIEEICKKNKISYQLDVTVQQA